MAVGVVGDSADRGQVRVKRCRDQLALVVLACAVGLVAPCGGPALAQFNRPNFDPDASVNPVFVDASPVTGDALARVGDHIASRNLDEAARVLQRLLDEHGHEVVATPTPGLFEPLRTRVHRTLRSDAELLSRYRERQEALARTTLEATPDASRAQAAGADRAAAPLDPVTGPVAVVRTRLMTDAGFDAALLVAQDLHLRGHFDAAVLVLGELGQHPALSDPARGALGAARAAALAGLIDALAPRVSDVGTRARLGELHQWLAGVQGGNAAREAALPAPIAPPAHARELPGVLTAGPELPPADLVPRPIGSGEINSFFSAIPPTGGTREDIERFPPWGVLLRSWPALSDSGVFVVDGTRLLGFDRLTARARWSVDGVELLGWNVPDVDRTFQPALARRSVLASEREDSAGPVAIGPVVVAVVGAEAISRFDSPEAVIGVEESTGRVRWARPLAQLDPQLLRASQRGPLLEGAGLAVLSMARNLPERRLRAAVLAGVEPATGEAAWVRTIASSGALPYLAAERVSDGAASRAGVIYRSDQLGVVAAYRASDGLPLWARVVPAPVAGTPDASPDEAFAMNTPALGVASMWVLTPDRREIIELDLTSGALLASAPAKTLSDPNYLLTCGPWLVGVTQTGLTCVPQAGWTAAEPTSSGELEAAPVGIRGRVTVAGERLLVPLPRGVAVMDPSSLREAVRQIRLDSPGTALAAPGGLVVVDDRRVHVYSTWALASERLAALAAAQGGRLVPASELLSLAERSGRAQDVLPALELSVAGAARAASEEDQAGVAAARRRIVELVLTIVERSELDLAGEGARLDRAGVDRAMAQVAKLAATPQQRAGVLLTGSRLALKRGDVSGALAQAQAVLEDPVLSEASWVGVDRVGLTAGAEARARVGQALRAGGRNAYGPFDARAEAQLARLDGPQPLGAAGSVEGVLRTFPGARVGPAKWLALAQARAGAADAPGEARALELGLQHASGLPDPDAQVVALLHGLLIENLERRGLVAAAYDALERAERASAGAGSVTITGRQGPLDVSALRTRLGGVLSAGERLARLGPPAPTGELQVLDGWAVATPMITVAALPGAGAGVNAGVGAGVVFVPMHSNEGKVGLFGLEAGALAREAATGAPEPLKPLWTDATIGNRPDVLLQDARGVVLFVPTEQGGKLLRAQADGTTPWQSEPFGTLFPAEPPLKFTGLQETSVVRVPLAGLRPASELIAAADGQTIVLVERTGRAAGFDSQRGELLWTGRLPLKSASEAALGGGQLVVCGLGDDELATRLANAGAAQVGQPGGRTPVVLTLDARSGVVTGAAPSPVSDVGWVRIGTGSRLIIIGGEQGLAGIDAQSGDVKWKLQIHPAASTRDAWLLDAPTTDLPGVPPVGKPQQRLVVLTSDTERALWRIDPLTGKPDEQPLITQRRLDTPGEVRLTALEGGRMVLASSRGVAVFDAGGKLVGLDATASEEMALVPQVVAGGVLTIVPAPANVGDAPMTLGLFSAMSIVSLDLPGARAQSLTPLRLGGTPHRLTAIDGRLLVTHGHSTTVIPALAK
jgi:hypothetical protein